jgi:Flp pilus assembly protein TadD
MFFFSLMLVVLLVGCRTPNGVLRQRGLLAMDAHNYDAAFENFRTAVNQDPTDWRAQYYFGVVLLERGYPLEAQLALEKARSLRPASPETADILDHLAEALYQQGRKENLHALVDEATEMFGTTRDFLRQAEYLAKTDEVDGAMIAYQKAVRFAAPGDATALIAMAAFYERIGDPPNAVATWRQAHRVEPNNELVAAKLRQYGIVPGPAAARQPQQP